MSKNDTDQEGGTERNKIQKAKDIIDFLESILVRIAVIGIVIVVELGLLDKLNKEECPISVALLAAIVIIVGLLVLSLTAFRGSLEDDVKKLHENLEALQGDLETLRGKIEK
jgi:predicted PurR-regulated permease PerM